MSLHDTPSPAIPVQAIPTNGHVCDQQLELRSLIAEADARPLPEPPIAKRGALTSNTGVHWLALSHSDPSGRAFCDLLGAGEDEWTVGEHGMRHYPRCRFLGNIRVGYGSEHNGSHMEISGEGCEELESREGFTTWGDFLSRAHELGMKESRLDLYKDDRSGAITVAAVEARLRAGQVTCRSSHARSTRSFEMGAGECDAGSSVSVGSRQSGTYFRFYDKAAQMAPKDETRAPWLAEHGDHTRGELELHGDRAQAVAAIIAERGFSPGFVGALINSYIELKEEEARGKNANRKETWGPWAAFIGTAEKIRHAAKAGWRSLAQKERWLDKQAGPTIAVLQAHYGGDTSWVKRMAARNVGRVSEKLIRALQDADGAKESALGWVGA